MRSCVHFVGFKGDEYVRALRVWTPDFIHGANDTRMRREIADGDTVVSANGCETRPAARNAPDLIEKEPQ